MKFNDMKYERPNYEDYKDKMNACIDEMEISKDTNAFMKAFNELNTLRTHISTMMILSSIRHTINTADAFYDTEDNYWNETSPKYDAIDTRMYKVTLNSSM